MIPTPPLEEQDKIVTEIESYESLIAQAQKVMDSYSEKKAEILKRYLS